MYISPVPLKASQLATFPAPKSHHGTFNKGESLGVGDGDKDSDLSRISDKLHNHQVSRLWCPFL